MREIVLDTETTGLDPFQGHRVVEIGCVELLNRIPTGVTFHRYLNPERDMPALALLSSTTLPLVVALTYLGVGRGQLAPETASALVGAAMVTVTAFPTLAFWLRGARQPSRLESGISSIAHTVADWFSSQAAGAFAKLPPRWIETLQDAERRLSDLFNRP